MPQSWPWGSLYIINLNNFIWTIESDWKLLTFESADITTKWYKLLLKISRWFIVLLFWFFCVIPVQKWYCQIDRFRNCLWKMMSNFRNSSIYRIIIWKKMKSTPILIFPLNFLSTFFRTSKYNLVFFASTMTLYQALKMTRSNDIWYTDFNEFIKRICFSFTNRTHAYKSNIVNNDQLIYSWSNFKWKTSPM